MVGTYLAPKGPILVLFCGMDHQKSNFLLIFGILSVRGCWVQPMILFWKTCWWNSNVRKSECQNHLQTKYNLHNSIRQIQITFLLIFLVISNLLWQFSTHLLRCEENYFFLLVFPVLSSRDSVLKRSQIIGLRPPTCTTFSQKCSCLQELGKQVTHTKKNFSHSKSRQL